MKSTQSTTPTDPDAQFDAWLRAMPKIPVDGTAEYTRNVDLTLTVSEWITLARTAATESIPIGEVISHCLWNGVENCELANREFHLEYPDREEEKDEAESGPRVVKSNVDGKLVELEFTQPVLAMAKKLAAIDQKDLGAEIECLIGQEYERRVSV